MQKDEDENVKLTSHRNILKLHTIFAFIFQSALFSFNR